MQLPADVETWEPERILGFLLETFPGKVALACSFQKEETIILDMLFALEPKARVFAIDTHHLFGTASGSGSRTATSISRSPRSRRS